MAFKTFNAGDVLTAADVNTYLAKQAVIVCTSGTRPSSPIEGMTIVETDTDRVLIYDGSNWQVVTYYGDGESYIPTLLANTTNPTMGTVTSLGRYWRRGARRIDVHIWIKIGAGFSAGSGAYAVTLPPVNVNATYNRQQLGFTFFDTSATAYYRGFAHAGEDAAVNVTNLGTAKLFLHGSSDFFPGVTNSTPVIPATGDIYEISGSYYI